MRNGWLVNGTLTCIPGTKTIWHDLLSWIPGLQDRTGGWTENNVLPAKIEREVMLEGNPDYIIRNATYFRRMFINSPTISLLQDVVPGDWNQIDVCNNSKFVVFNTLYTKSIYQHIIKAEHRIIPLGVSFDLFKPLNDNSLREKMGILPDSILFVGANNVTPKGFDLMLDIINKSNYNFCLVMKDDYQLNTNRVKTFNKVNHDTLVKIYNSCKMLLCTSNIETQHLGGIEAGACGLPIIASNVGIYFNRENGKWGRRVNARTIQEYITEIKYVFDNPTEFDPRSYFREIGMDQESCSESWQSLIAEL